MSYISYFVFIYSALLQIFRGLLLQRKFYLRIFVLSAKFTKIYKNNKCISPTTASTSRESSPVEASETELEMSVSEW